jgi:hypothetical protein
MSSASTTPDATINAATATSVLIDMLPLLITNSLALVREPMGTV